MALSSISAALISRELAPLNELEWQSILLALGERNMMLGINIPG